MRNSSKRKFFAGSALCGFAFLLFSLSAYAQSTTTFNIDKGYDAKGRETVEATLERASPNGFFYLENEYMANLAEDDRARIRQALADLSNEFEGVIYPRLTQLYGEVGAGPDGSSAITVLFHEMGDTAGGYFNPKNLYPKSQEPTSNERNLVHLNIKKIRFPIMKALFAHEFQHVVSFYQKDKRLRQSEDVWLNELRSEYAPTYLGYDDTFWKSNLEQRVAAFLENPSDSLTEWSGGKYDYGTVNMFGQYLVDHFGKDLLQKSMQSSVVGIESIEAAFKMLGQSKSFSDVFRDWVVASFLNDCSVLPQDVYCYKNPNLSPRVFKVQLSGLGQGGKVGVAPTTKAWEGNWYEFGTTDFKPQKLKFYFSSGDPSASFRIPYVLKRRGKPLEVHEFSLLNQKVDFVFEHFGDDIFAIAVMPFQQGKRSRSSVDEPSIPFSLQANIIGEDNGETAGREIPLVQVAEQVPPPKPSDEKDIEKEAVVIQLQKQIAEFEQQLFLLLQKKQEEAQQRFSYEWKRDLYAGLRGDKDVRALQLALQDQRVYSGPVTGNFFRQTQEGAKKFQEKYGLPQIGRVGPQTRVKLNEIYRK